MLSPLLLFSLVAYAAETHTASLGGPPGDPPPWTAALVAKVGAMEGELTAMKTTIATQANMLKAQGETIAEHS